MCVKLHKNSLVCWYLLSCLKCWITCHLKEELCSCLLKLALLFMSSCCLYWHLHPWIPVKDKREGRMNVQTDRGVTFLHDFTSVCASPLHQLEATLDAVQVQLTHFGSSYINMTALFSLGCFTGSFSYLFYIKNRNTYLKPTTIIICSEILSNYMCKYAPND